MKELVKRPTQKLTLSSIFIALGTVLSLIKVYEMPLGGSVTLLSMLPIIMLALMLDFKWALGSAFVYSLIQLFLGVTEGLFSWGLTPIALVGTIFLDYIIPFTALSFAGILGKGSVYRISLGAALVLIFRFLCHFLSGFIIFTQLEQFAVFGNSFFNRPVLYSLCYNGFYMLPELITTVVAIILIFNIPQIKKLINQ